jgi:hypothetical protein
VTIAEPSSSPASAQRPGKASAWPIRAHWQTSTTPRHRAGTTQPSPGRRETARPVVENYARSELSETALLAVPAAGLGLLPAPAGGRPLLTALAGSRPGRRAPRLPPGPHPDRERRRYRDGHRVGGGDPQPARRGAGRRQRAAAADEPGTAGRRPACAGRGRGLVTALAFDEPVAASKAAPSALLWALSLTLLAPALTRLLLWPARSVPAVPRAPDRARRQDRRPQPAASTPPP